jgi:pimeloyl-ACP methyl ester carboxylesterase
MPPFPGSDLALLPLSAWLEALGYRPIMAGSVHLGGIDGDSSLSQAIREVTGRVGRRAVLITHSFGMMRALRAAETHRDLISDVVIFEPPYTQEIDGVRAHFISSGWSALLGMMELSRLLRMIGIELIEGTDTGSLVETVTTDDAPVSARKDVTTEHNNRGRRV